MVRLVPVPSCDLGMDESPFAVRDLRDCSVMQQDSLIGNRFSFNILAYALFGHVERWVARGVMSWLENRSRCCYIF